MPQPIVAAVFCVADEAATENPERAETVMLELSSCVAPPSVAVTVIVPDCTIVPDHDDPDAGPFTTSLPDVNFQVVKVALDGVPVQVIEEPRVTVTGVQLSLTTFVGALFD